MFFFLIPAESREDRWEWFMSHLGDKEMTILHQEAYAILQNADDAEDVVQNALLKGLQKCHQIKDENKMFFWMVTIVRNEAYSYFKRFNLHTAWAVAKLSFTKPSYENGAEYYYLQEQEQRCLRKMINELQYPDKEILLMRIEQGMPFPEIAKKLGMNYHTVRSQYRRILQKLKLSLERDDL